jgi:hypothetical protein
MIPMKKLLAALLAVVMMCSVALASTALVVDTSVPGHVTVTPETKSSALESGMQNLSIHTKSTSGYSNSLDLNVTLTSPTPEERDKDDDLEFYPDQPSKQTVYPVPAIVLRDRNPSTGR